MFYDLQKINKTHPLFNVLEQCRGIHQAPEHHPEGDVFTHSVQVLWWAFKESTDIDLIFAAMLHDVGKRIDSKGHEKYSVKFVDGYISEKTEWLILNHMRFWYFVLGDMKKRSKVESIAGHKWLPELALLARWDKLGRNPNKRIEYDRLDVIHRLRQIAEGY